MTSSLINRKQVNYDVWKSIKQVFSNSFFIFFSFVNLFIPFYATMISALSGPNGILNVVALGLASSFVTIFNQFLFLLSLSIIFVFRKNQNLTIHDKNDRRALSIIVIIIALISILLFVGSASLYIKFSAIYKNFTESIELGFNYVFIVAPSLLINGFIYLETFYRYTENKKSSWLIIILLLALNLLIIPLIGFFPNWKTNMQTFGIGLGILVSSIATLTIIFLTQFKPNYFSMVVEWRRVKFFLAKIHNFLFNFLLSTLMKSILIMGVALSVGLSQKDSPVALMVAKIIWYNSLFLCGFFADGLLYSMEYTRLEHFMNNDDNYQLDFRVWNRLALISTITTVVICIIFNFCSFPLSDLYCSHQTNTLQGPLPTGVWPYDSTPAIEVKKYLWSPQGVENIQLVIVDQSTGTLSFEKSSCFALMYITIYHTFINATKLLSISDIKMNQKFSWKSLISNFIMISIVMVIIVVFSTVPKSHGFLKVFCGLDAFSFGLMMVSLLLFTLTALGYFQKMKAAKSKK